MGQRALRGRLAVQGGKHESTPCTNRVTTLHISGGLGRYHDSCATRFRVRRSYHHSYAISKSRAGVSAGLGGFVGFRQLPGRIGEVGRFCECERPDLSDRPTRVTAENLRSRRPEFFARAQGHRATRAAPVYQNGGRATREGFAGEAVRGQSSTNIYQKIAGRGRRWWGGIIR